MKKIALLSILFIICSISLTPVAFSETATAMATGSMAVTGIFSIEFYRDGQTVIYDTYIPFTNMPAVPPIVDGQEKWFIYPDGRRENDGKSDTGIICRTNAGETWYLKIKGASQTFPLKYFLFYLGQPYDRNNNKPADGTLTYTDGKWHEIPTDLFAVYTAGAKDKSNLPLGTIATFSFAIKIHPGMGVGATHTIVISYTMTTTM